jgi:hypothetical protein
MRLPLRTVGHPIDHSANATKDERQRKHLGSHRGPHEVSSDAALRLADRRSRPKHLHFKRLIGRSGSEVRYGGQFPAMTDSRMALTEVTTAASPR